MSEMFCECSSLSLLPDISNWNTINVTIKDNDIFDMFDGCQNIIIFEENRLKIISDLVNN